MGERSRLAYERYRSRLGALPSRGELGALLRNDAHFMALYKDIYGEMVKPYLFSDHANKSFERQYRHLRRAVPAAFAPRVAGRESMRGLPPGRLPAGARRAVAAYLPADAHDQLLRAMAVAANTAAAWYSDCSAYLLRPVGEAVGDTR